MRSCGPALASVAVRAFDAARRRSVGIASTSRISRSGGASARSGSTRRAELTHDYDAVGHRYHDGYYLLHGSRVYVEFEDGRVNQIVFSVHYGRVSEILMSARYVD
jgi:hypothetical protein